MTVQSAFWNVDNVDKPWGKWDPKAELDIPFKWTDWLAASASSYASHQVNVEAPLEVITSSQAGGIVTVFVRVLVGQTVQLNRKYYVECEITTNDVPPRKDNRRVYLKMVER